MSKKALLFSVQNFQTPIEPQLTGCENDTKIWENTLTNLGFSVDKHHDKKRNKAFNTIKKFINNLKGGETGIIFFSGHATNIYLRNIGITIEGLTFSDNKNIYEFQILQELTNLNSNATLILIIDSCYSRGFSQYKCLSLKNDLQDYYSTDGLLELEYGITDDKIDNLFVSITSDKINRDFSRVPNEIMIPSELLQNEIKRKEISEEIKIHIEDSYHSSKIFRHTEKGLIYEDRYETKNNQTVTYRGKTVTDTSNTITPPTTTPLRIRGYDNITLIAAEESISQKAHERYFSVNDGYKVGQYGAFSYYANKEISKNQNITYNKLKDLVNTAFSNDLDEKIRKQRMNFDSGNTNEDRKLFT